MRTYNYFWDLKGATAYSDCMIRSYASHTTFGGGMFKWVPIVGVVTDLPGIRIQPSANTNGYFERVMGNEIYADWFGPVHANTTFAGASLSTPQASALYPTPVVTTPSDPAIPYTIADTDNIDWAALQAGITYACNTKRPLLLGGADYYVNKSLYVNKFVGGSNVFTLDGGGAEIWTVNNNTFNILTRQSPNDQAQADSSMSNTRFDIKNLRMGSNGFGQTNQTGISLGPSYGAQYTNLLIAAHVQGIHLKFALNTTVNNVEFNLCRRGLVVDKGDWPGVTLSNAQSNVTTVNNCRAVMYGYSTNSYGYGFFDADGCSVNNSIVEGYFCEYGILFDTQASNWVYNFVVNNVHFECSPSGSPTGDGCVNSAIKIDALAGTYSIANIYGQHPCTLIDTEISGETSIMVSGIYYWVPSVVDGSMFRNRTNNAGTWLFIGNAKNALNDAAGLALKFSTNNGTGGPVGVVPTYLASLVSENLGAGPYYRLMPTAS